MVILLATAAAGLVLLLFSIALLAMSSGNLQVAGLCFLSAAIVIYLRETRLVNS
ncbi:hypothetical protein [Haladaptatus halobius]|uniref:hypothetical protein n=1 Tax=Haladaptatus halobius TaxID=2884875 RepID=UPI001D0AF1DE|nr:hypothetical protein [Haladaptatus halobius]